MAKGQHRTPRGEKSTFVANGGVTKRNIYMYNLPAKHSKVTGEGKLAKLIKWVTR